VKIQASSLNLRFYEKDGWVPGRLEEYGADPIPCAHYDETPREHRYWVISAWSRKGVLVDKLAADCTKLERSFDDYPAESDEQFIRRML